MRPEARAALEVAGDEGTGVTSIPYGRQCVDEEDVAAVVAVLRSDWLTQGPAGLQFEADLCRVTGAKYAVAFSSGTAALHAACAAGGLGPGDNVGTSSLSFVASANCIRYVGATPVLLDIDPDTLNLSPADVPAGLDGLVAVHFAGRAMDLGLLGHRPRVVIEDAAHALGALTPYGPVGNCASSDMCAFSFHPVKTITTGEGGAVTTNSSELAGRLRRFRSHGMVSTPEEGGWAYEVAEIGWNYRLTDLQAALGSSQLTKLERFVTRRNELAASYHDLLAGTPLILPPRAPDGWRHGQHLFVVQVENRRAVYESLRRAGIGVQVHYIPIHRQPLYRVEHQLPLPGVEKVADRLLSLPLFPGLTDSEQRYVVDRLKALL